MLGDFNANCCIAFFSVENQGMNAVCGWRAASWSVDRSVVVVLIVLMKDSCRSLSDRNRSTVLYNISGPC